MTAQQPVKDGHPLKGSIAYLVYASVVSALGGFLFGYDTVVVNGTVIQVVKQFSLTATMQGTFVGSALFGCMLGAAMAGFVSDRYGRKVTLAAAAMLMLVSALGCGIAWDAWSLVFFRWIGGVGVGIASMVCPLYISEISPEHLRGRLVTLFQFAITVGIFVAFLMNAGWQKLSDADAGTTGQGWYHLWVVQEVWRAMFATEALPAAAFFVLCLTIPETPRFLAAIGKAEQALSVLAKISGIVVAKRQMDEINSVITEEKGTLSELFGTGFRKALFIGLFLAIISEMSGVTVVLYYGAEILKSANVPLGEALGGFSWIGLVNMVFTVIALWLMDKAGRRTLLFWGTLGCSAALATIGFLFYTQRSGGIGIVAMICLFMACFAFSIGPIKWVVMSEIFPTKIRGRAVAIATFAVWMTDWIYNQLYPIITKELLFRYTAEHIATAIVFFFFAAVLIPQLWFVVKVMPETKNRTLEEIERSWMSHSF